MVRYCTIKNNIILYAPEANGLYIFHCIRYYNMYVIHNLGVLVLLPVVSGVVGNTGFPKVIRI